MSRDARYLKLFPRNAHTRTEITGFLTGKGMKINSSIRRHTAGYPTYLNDRENHWRTLHPTRRVLLHCAVRCHVTRGRDPAIKQVLFSTRTRHSAHFARSPKDTRAFNLAAESRTEIHRGRPSARFPSGRGSLHRTRLGCRISGVRRSWNEKTGQGKEMGVTEEKEGRRPAAGDLCISRRERERESRS